jgi:hypothetical protein
MIDVGFAGCARQISRCDQRWVGVVALRMQKMISARSLVARHVSDRADGGIRRGGLSRDPGLLMSK